MSKHLRANLWLLAFTLGICSVLYPAVLLGIGQVLFPHQAEGSLIRDKNGKVIGSELIAQPFTSPEYFQPRPSAASYNAAASGASNWAASNYQLRERVARALGPIVKYKSGPQKGQPVGPDVQRWFQSKPDLVAQWAKAHSSVAQGWVKADKLNTAYVAAWQASHADEVAQWVKDNPDTPDPKPEDLAVPFFESFSRTYPGTFPDTVEQKNAEGKTEKIITPVKEGTAIQGYFFDLWRQEHPQAELEDVPADLVMASGSGLDPHITLDNARFQLDGVADAWAAKTKQDPARVRRAIDKLLQDRAKAPLGGLVGKPLINVLEVNRALRGLMEQLAAGSGGNGGPA
jgi:potassium-transporting ATPase KdpC subunit